MGVHLCAAWANAGYNVTMCSRSKEKAQEIVDTLVTRNVFIVCCSRRKNSILVKTNEFNAIIFA